MSDEQPASVDSGLFAGDRRAIPLEGVRIDARLEGLATEVTVAQRYRNRETVAVEAVYVFPLEEGAAVCGFEARIGDRVIRGRVEEREKAFAIYDDAMAKGHGAFLLDQERPNVFTASVGNLRPEEAVEIRITYVALARHDGRCLRLMIPTTVSPRYVPPEPRPPEPRPPQAGPPQAGPPEVGPPETGQGAGRPDGERVNPERWLSVPYGLELRVEAGMDSPIESIESPSHPVRVETRETGAVVELSRQRAALDRDFVLRIETSEPHRPSVRTARENDGTGVCQLTFYPDFDEERSGSRAGAEVIFLLDCSGSMIGDSIDQARRALALSIRSLEEGDSFQVVRFGSTFESLWRHPRRFGESTLDEATEYIDAVEADLGGTEISAPLSKVLKLCRDAERKRRILLLTDGQVANERAVVRLAEESAGEARIFTFGIGAGASEYLVRELARVSRGAAEFIFPGERIEPKVLRMLGRVRAPAADGVALDWGTLEAEQAPSRTPPVFGGDSLTVFGRVRGGESGVVTLSAGGDSWQLEVDFESAETGGAIPALWARETLRELERGIGRGSAQRRPEAERRQRQRLVELGRRYGLISSATSYVAVEERPPGERVEGAAELRRIPIALTTGWGGIGRLVAGHGPPRARVGAAKPANLHLASPPMLAQASAGPRGALHQLTNAIGGLFGKAKPRRARRPAAARPARPARRATDRLYALLMTQKADGSFHWSRELEKWLGADLVAAKRAAGEHGEAVVATALALALLERDEAAREDQWRPAAGKARKWLARQPADFDVQAVLGGQLGTAAEPSSESL